MDAAPFTPRARMAEDLARQLGKQARLEFVGDDTIVQTSTANAMEECLLHLVRNGLDHGIEAPAERAEAGKAREGIISISFQSHGSEGSKNIRLVVRDDGRGIDPVRIAEACVKKGLKTREDIDALTTQQLLELVTLPGLSTAASITDVSGRGVGMDIIRSRIEELGGRLKVSSEQGSGTQFEIDLPDR